jgi:hypothetical protein
MRDNSTVSLCEKLFEPMPRVEEVLSAQGSDLPLKPNTQHRTLHAKSSS